MGRSHHSDRARTGSRPLPLGGQEWWAGAVDAAVYPSVQPASAETARAHPAPAREAADAGGLQGGRLVNLKVSLEAAAAVEVT